MLGLLDFAGKFVTFWSAKTGQVPEKQLRDEWLFEKAVRQAVAGVKTALENTHKAIEVAGCGHMYSRVLEEVHKECFKQ